MRKSIQQKIEEKSIRNGECVRWIGSADGNGRPHIWYDGRLVKVSRLIMHLLHNFDLDSDLQVNHKQECVLGVGCINDQHLYIGNQFANMVDRSDSTTHCYNGHEYTIENTGYQNGGYKYCKICSVNRGRERRKEMRQ